MRWLLSPTRYIWVNLVGSTILKTFKMESSFFVTHVIILSCTIHKITQILNYQNNCVPKETMKGTRAEDNPGCKAASDIAAACSTMYKVIFYLSYTPNDAASGEPSERHFHTNTVAEHAVVLSHVCETSRANARAVVLLQVLATRSLAGCE